MWRVRNKFEETRNSRNQAFRAAFHRESIMRRPIGLLLSLVALAAAAGPCVVSSDECTDLIDSSACYNGAISSKNATALFLCGQGGPHEVNAVCFSLLGVDMLIRYKICACYGCDRGLEKFVLGNNLCNTTSNRFSKRWVNGRSIRRSEHVSSD